MACGYCNGKNDTLLCNCNGAFEARNPAAFERDDHQREGRPGRRDDHEAFDRQWADTLVGAHAPTADTIAHYWCGQWPYELMNGTPCADCKAPERCLQWGKYGRSPASGAPVVASSAAEAYHNRGQAEYLGPLLERELEIMGTKVVKHDSGKAPIAQGFFAYFPRAIAAISWTSEYGSRKYSWGAWKKTATVNDSDRFANAAARHDLAPFIGDPYDAESGLANLVQRAWNVLAELELLLEGGAIETRIGNEIGPDGKPIPGTHRKA